MLCLHVTNVPIYMYMYMYITHAVQYYNYKFHNYILCTILMMHMYKVMYMYVLFHYEDIRKSARIYMYTCTCMYMYMYMYNECSLGREMSLHVYIYRYANHVQIAFWLFTASSATLSATCIYRITFNLAAMALFFSAMWILSISEPTPATPSRVSSVAPSPWTCGITQCDGHTCTCRWTYMCIYMYM